MLITLDMNEKLHNSIKYSGKVETKESKTFGIVEPVRKTMYDVVLENLQIAERKTFLHRLIIVGQHSFKDDRISNLFSDSVSEVNATFNFEKVTGLLLHYNKHFIHMVEGDEKAIHRQIRCLFNHKLFQKIEKVKVLMHISHIKSRLVTDWLHYHGVPSKRLGEANMEGSVEEATRHLYTCIRKFYNFVKLYTADNDYVDDLAAESTRNTEDDSGSLHAINTLSRRNESRITLNSSSQNIGTFKEPYKVTLPEVEILEYILANDFFQTLKEYHGIFGEVPQRDIYKDKVWPVPSDLVPYDVFHASLNILMNLSDVRKRQETKEGAPDDLMTTLQEHASVDKDNSPDM